MKIFVEGKLVDFAILKTGNIFKWYDSIYIKVDRIKDDEYRYWAINSVNLENGAYDYFEEDMKVLSLLDDREGGRL